MPAPLEPLDLSALDGFLCGVLLQPRPLPRRRAGWPFVADVEGRRAAARASSWTQLHALVLRRHAELDRAIAAAAVVRPLDLPSSKTAAPARRRGAALGGRLRRGDGPLSGADAPTTTRALDRAAGACCTCHFDPDDLEDADALLEVIETLEPPADLAEAAEDLVRSRAADGRRHAAARATAGGPARGMPLGRAAPIGPVAPTDARPARCTSSTLARAHPPPPSPPGLRRRARLACSRCPARRYAADTPSPRPRGGRPAGRRRASRHRRQAAGRRAVAELRKVNATGNADWNNLMGYALRKQPTPDLDGAQRHYDAALRIDPRHQGALEYCRRAGADEAATWRARHERAGSCGRVCTVALRGARRPAAAPSSATRPTATASVP
ncbi:MAG: UPF0149 family protein [Comamonadaceae bacterium]|nr:UPF0149 family protein [Comamonadaceae bacterium]